MLLSYFKIALRNLWRHKVYSSINVLGLATGMACCTVILLYVTDELSYDRYHADAGQIYRVVKDFVNDDGTRLPDATTPPALAPAIQEEIPEIAHTVRIFPSWGTKYLIRYGENRFLEERVYRVDSSLFDVFSFPFVQGNAKTAFSQLKSIILTESAAHKYFGNEEPMGKSLEIDQMGSHLVTGVLKDVPPHSHFHFDFLISTRTIGGGNLDENWDFYNFYTYVKLKDQTSMATVEPKIKALFKKHQPQNTSVYYAQALTDIHLNSQLKWELEPNGDRLYVYIFITIALFVIFIAGINYANLSTARSATRAKEVGVRKVVGAFRGALARQFLSESVVMALLASLVAAVLVKLVLPVFNHITQKELAFSFADNAWVPVLLLATAVLVGVVAGLYPALYLSSFEPVSVLKGLPPIGKSGFSLRKSLVILQFTISITLLVGVVTITRQIDYIQSAKLGLDKEQVVMVSDVGYLSRANRSALKNELLRIPGVKKVGAVDGIVGGQNWTNGLSVKGSDQEQLVNFLNIDADFLGVLGIELKEGRNFSPRFPSDTLDGIILNETAVKQLGVPKPVIGQQIVWGRDGNTITYVKVVGVVKDFHFTSLRSEIKPFAFVTDNNRQFYYAIKIGGKGVSHTLAQIQSKWKSMVPDRPFQSFFLDETYARLYQSEEHFQAVFFYFTLLAIAISCLGLFGLSAFMAEQRTKEIGIRKVLGASVANIVGLLSKDFLQLVLIANLIAWPLAWYAMSRWLENFAYRISLSWWMFALAAVAALLIALLTVSFQAVKAAIANPVKSLRTE